MKQDRTALEMAQKLRSLRRQSGMSTRALAQLTGFSQSKVSQIERCRTTPSVGDVERLLVALDVHDKVKAGILEDARAAVRRPPLPTGCGVPGSSVSLAQATELAESARELRCSGDSFVPLYFQSPEYMRMTYAQGSQMTPFDEFMETKLRRQARTYGPKTTSVVCLVDSTVLIKRRLPVDDWIIQLERFKERMRFPGVELGILNSTEITTPVRSMHVFDKYSVTFENLGSPSVFSFSVLDAEAQATYFDELAKRAHWGQEAIDDIDRAIEMFQDPTRHHEKARAVTDVR